MTNLKDKSVYISVPSNRSPEWGMILTLIAAMEHARQKGIVTKFRMQPMLGESLIPRARNTDAMNFMDSGYDYLYSQDDDIEIPTHTLSHMIEMDKDIIAGAYRLKDDKEGLGAIRLKHDGIPLRNILRDGLCVEAQYVSTGCMMVKRHVVEQMIQAYPDLFYKQNITAKPCHALYNPFIYGLEQEYLSEDWAFCQRALDIGFKVWLDGAIHCKHWGKVAFEFNVDL